jgi:hypothetical protein
MGGMEKTKEIAEERKSTHDNRKVDAWMSLNPGGARLSKLLYSSQRVGGLRPLSSGAEIMFQFVS